SFCETRLSLGAARCAFLAAFVAASIIASTNGVRSGAFAVRRDWTIGRQHAEHDVVGTLGWTADEAVIEPTAEYADLLVGAVAIDIDLAGQGRAVHEDADPLPALVARRLLGPDLDHEGDVGHRLSSAERHAAALDVVLLAVKGITADGAEARRAHRACVPAGDLQQARRPLGGDARARRAVEPCPGDDFPSLAPAAAIELRDQAAQRLRAMRKQQLVELHRVVPERRRLALVATAPRHRFGLVRPRESLAVRR